jgi:hypothetical protein
VTRHPFEYAALRAVPRIDRGEFVNVGVILYCQERDFLAMLGKVDPARLRALDAGADAAAVEDALAAVEAACAGEGSAGPVASGPPGVRFRWLTAPRSTILQPGPVHSGMTDDPRRQLERLFAQLVSAP